VTKIVIESGVIFNLGGYVVESLVKPDFIDVVVGNPLAEDIKVDIPILNKEMLSDLEKGGLILEYIGEEDTLKDVLESVKEKVEAATGKK